MEENIESRSTENEDLSQKFGAYCIEDDTPLVLCNKSNITIDAKLNCSLFDFQRRGIQQMFLSFVNDSGAIINDIPGSGKKVQVIAFISALISSQRQLASGDSFSSEVHPALIICPRGKIHVWESRIKQWSSLKHSVCFDLNISKATDSTDVVLFPFDLLAKSVVNVAKRKWMILFVDNIEVIMLKQKYELLLHHLPRDFRFGISSKSLDDSETLASVVGWAYPAYYEQFKKDRSKILSFIKHFENKFGPVADQIRGLHLKANLLSLKNEVFIKRDGNIPEALSAIPRDAEDDIDFCPNTTSAKTVPLRRNKRRSNEKIKPKVKSSRISSRDRAPTHDVSDDDNDYDDNNNGSDYTAQNKQNLKRNEEEIAISRLPRRKMNMRSNHSEDSSSHGTGQPICSRSTSRSVVKSPEPQPSSSKSSNTEENQPNSSSSSTSTMDQNTDYDPIDALFFSSTKVLKSPQKSRKRASQSQREETNKELSDAESRTNTANTEESMGVFGDFETQQLDLLNSLFLKTPPVTKPPPSKFKSFTQASQKTTKTNRERIDGKLSETDKGVSMSQDLDLFFDSQMRKPPPRKLEESKVLKQAESSASSSHRPEDLLDEILFSQPVPRRGPPKKKFLTQSDALSDAGTSSRQPMVSIKNQTVKLDQNSQLFD